jgi:hypothetical protein
LKKIGNDLVKLFCVMKEDIDLEKYKELQYSRQSAENCIHIFSVDKACKIEGISENLQI